MFRVPTHVGIIPDGNRRYAQACGLKKEMGYEKGLAPGLACYKILKELGVREITYYGFTVDNTKRPAVQTKAFIKACIDAVELLTKEDAELLVIGNTASKMFPQELLKYTVRQKFGKGGIKINFLVNYSWQWDFGVAKKDRFPITNSCGVSRIDLVIRWGGRCRLSGFLPIQTVYSDFYFIDEYWPSFKREHILSALEWYSYQDVTLGG